MPVALSEILKQKSRDIYSVTPMQTIALCAKNMNDHKIGAVPVLDKNGHMVGIFTERDILTKVIYKNLNINTTPVKEVMTEKFIFVSPETRIGEAMKVISSKRVRHLPIVVNNKLLGILSSGDIMKWIIESQELLIDALCDEKIEGQYK